MENFSKNHIFICADGNCQICINESKKTSVAEILERFKSIHGSRYDYSDFIYSGNHVPGKIKCSEHGYFEQRPDHHITGHGCIRCGISNSILKQRKPLDKFLVEANKVHGLKYGYDKVNYTGNANHINIFCYNNHGIFSQSAGSHLQGHRLSKM